MRGMRTADADLGGAPLSADVAAWPAYPLADTRRRSRVVSRDRPAPTPHDHAGGDARSATRPLGLSQPGVFRGSHRTAGSVWRRRETARHPLRTTTPVATIDLRRARPVGRRGSESSAEVFRRPRAAGQLRETVSQ